MAGGAFEEGVAEPGASDAADPEGADLVFCDFLYSAYFAAFRAVRFASISLRNSRVRLRASARRRTRGLAAPFGERT